ncbi:DUF397 domain-containing protein [Streptomyces sp. AC563]|uniref:DUF397 domain-containing protein n=1 Tax=Streptomyces buecherae TaxID=2763006 RepID=UPI00164D7F15|nr:DUF397 domain-containing protein [Streptomyces buecherae]MBC3987332.1 DUF397 domain-containing protein [Streptomyces buecherae]
MTPLRWRKSSFSAGDAANCVELAADPVGAPRLRESTDPATVITTTRPALRALLSSVKAGRLDGVQG